MAAPERHLRRRNRLHKRSAKASAPRAAALSQMQGDLHRMRHGPVRGGRSPPTQRLLCQQRNRARTQEIATAGRTGTTCAGCCAHQRARCSTSLASVGSAHASDAISRPSAAAVLRIRNTAAVAARTTCASGTVTPLRWCAANTLVTSFEGCRKRVLSKPIEIPPRHVAAFRE